MENNEDRSGVNDKNAPNKAFKEWDTQDVSMWLKDILKLPQYCETFRKYTYHFRPQNVTLFVLLFD